MPFLLIGAQMQGDLGPRRALGRSTVYSPRCRRSSRIPAHAWSLPVRAAREHRDLVCHDEGGVEADAELADEMGVLLLIAGETAEEFPRSRLGDGAQVLHASSRDMPMRCPPP